MLTGIQGRPPITGPGAPGGNDHRTVLLVQSDDADGSVTFVDSSHGGRYGQGHASPIASVSGDAQHDTAQAKIGASALRFDGSGDAITIPAHEDFQFGASQFTIDFWFRYASTVSPGTARNVMGCTTSGSTPDNGWVFAQDNTNGGNHILFYAPNASGGAVTAQSANVWYHVAVVADGENLKLYLDGALESTSPMTDIGPAGGNLILGTDSQFRSWGAFNGWLDEVRISRWPRWLSDFTPSTAHYER